MVALKIQNFAGMIPVRDPTALPDNAAELATNIKTESGTISGIRSAALITTLQSTTRRVYRIPTSADTSDLSQSFWMEFEDPNTDVVRTPIVNDSFERVYWCSPSEGMRYSTKAAILAGTPDLKLGVRAPTTAPSLNVIGGAVDEEGEFTAPLRTRSYCATFVSIYGEESQPGLTVEGVGPGDANWVLTNIPQPTQPVGEVPIDKVRIYRTITAASGTTTFFLVREVEIGVTGFTDDTADTTISGKPQLLSTTWAPPIEGLQGIIAMPNGIFVSWKDNNLYFSENYRPHAWPAEYMITVQYPIVGLGVFGNTCVVCTKGQPSAVTGVKSANMNLITNSASIPCLSRRSIVSTPEGVMYASETGMILQSPQGIANLTKEFIGRDKWTTEYHPDQLRAVTVEGVYTAINGDAVTDGFQIDQSGVIFVDVPGPASDVMVDVWSGKPLVISQGNVYEWQKAGATPLPWVWRSKMFRTPFEVNFGCYEAFYQADPTIPPIQEVLRIKVYVLQRGDKVLTRKLIYDQGLNGFDSSKVKRLPAGFKADYWQFELSGTARLEAFHVATTIGELRRV